MAGVLDVLLLEFISITCSGKMATHAFVIKDLDASRRRLLEIRLE